MIMLFHVSAVLRTKPLFQFLLVGLNSTILRIHTVSCATSQHLHNLLIMKALNCIYSHILPLKIPHIFCHVFNPYPLPHFTASLATFLNSLPSYTSLVRIFIQNLMQCILASHTTGSDFISHNSDAFGCGMPTPKNILKSRSCTCSIDSTFQQQPHTSAPYNMLDFTSDSISFLKIPIATSLISDQHLSRHAPGALPPASALSSTISFKSILCSSTTHPKYLYDETIRIASPSTSYFTSHLATFFLRMCMIPHLSTLIFTPHSLHHSTNTSKLFFIPDSSGANKHVLSANGRPGTFSSPHSTPHFSSCSLFVAP